MSWAHTDVTDFVPCVGSREVDGDMQAWIASTGALLVRNDYVIISGNAEGADQAWQTGGNSVDPARVIVCQPWHGYNMQALHPRNHVRQVRGVSHSTRVHLAEVAAAVHPRWVSLSRSDRDLHIRNVFLCEGSAGILGAPNHKKAGGGGTGMSIRLAKFWKIPFFDVTRTDVRNAVEGWIHERRPLKLWEPM